MTKQQAQREANKTKQPVWFATGDGGGEYVHPDPKAIKAAANRRMRDQVRRDCGLVRVRGALGGVYWE